VRRSAIPEWTGCSGWNPPAPPGNGGGIGKRTPRYVAQPFRAASSLPGYVAQPFRAACSGHRKPQRRGRAIPRCPQRLALLVLDEGLWRRPIIVPVLFVLRPHARELDWKGRIPVGKVRRAGDARVNRREPLVGCKSGNRDDARECECGRPGREPGSRIPQVVVDLDAIARCGVELARCPVVQHNRIPCSGIRRCEWRTRVEEIEIGRGNQRVRDLPIALANRVGEIREEGRGREAKRGAGVAGGRLERLVEYAARALDDDGRRIAGDRDLRAEILEAQHVPEPRSHDGFVRACDEQRVDLRSDSKVALDSPERGEDRAHVRLLRLKRELAELLSRLDA
jgi:hypothetical protein